MSQKPQLRPSQPHPNTKTTFQARSNFHSLGHSSRKDRHLSTETDRNADDGKVRRQIIRLRERVQILQNENMVLHKTKIEQENQLGVWMDKARRLTQELQRSETLHFQEPSYASPNRTVKNELDVLQEQARQLAYVKVQIQQQLSLQRERVKSLLNENAKNKSNWAEIQHLENKLVQSKDMLEKKMAALERSEAKAIRNQGYILKLERDVQFLERKLSDQLGVLEGQKLAEVDKWHFEKKRLEQTLNAQRQKFEQALKSQLQNNEQLRLQNAKMKEQLQNCRRQQAMAIEKRQQLLKSWEKLQSDYSTLANENQALRNKEETTVRITRDSSVQLDALRRQISSFQAKIRELHEQRDKMTLQLAKTTEENKLLRQIKEDLTSKISLLETSPPKMPVQRKLFKSDEKTFSFSQKNQASQVVLQAEIQSLEQKLTQQKAQTVKLSYQLEKCMHQQMKLESERRQMFKEKQILSNADKNNNQLLKKLRDKEDIIIEQNIEIERLKHYKISQLEDARREIKHYRVICENLQQKLAQQKLSNISALQQAQTVYAQLRQAAVHQQEHHLKQLNIQKQQQQAKLERAMDEIQAQFRKLLNQSQAKLHRKEAQLKELKEEVSYLRGQLHQVQGSKRRQIETMKTEAFGQAQRQAKIRYEKSQEEKIVQIQRLRLQLADLQQQLKRGAYAKRQLETAQTKLRALEREDIEKSDRLRYLQKINQNYQSQIRSQKMAREEMQADLKALQRQPGAIRQLQQLMMELERQLSIQRNRQVRLSDEKAMMQQDLAKEQSISREWRQKYQELLSQKDRTISNATTRERELKSLIKELQNTLQHKINTIQRLQSQCDKFESSCREAQGKQSHFNQTLEDHKKTILHLTSELQEKTHDIKMLLEKLGHNEADNAATTALIFQKQQIKRSNRMRILQKLGQLAGITVIQQERALQSISQWVKNIYQKLVTLDSQIGEQRALLVKVTAQLESVSDKYAKYKAMVIDMKERQSRGKQEIKNTYRFNQEILGHCQDLIKNIPR